MPAEPVPALRVALIGCGRIAQHAHLPALAALPGVEVAALADLDQARRDACRTQVPRALAFDDYRALLERGGIDAAVICLPPALHAAAAVECFGRGLHVYLEKPLATTLEDGEMAVAAWRRAGTVGSVGFNIRFHPLVARLRDALRQGALGHVVGGQTVFCAARRALPDWKRHRTAGGGALLDLASHHVDLVRFVFDQEIAEVSALLRSVESEEDTAVIDARLTSGTLVTTFVSLAAVEEDRIEIYGTDGKLVMDRYRSSRLSFAPPHRAMGGTARLRAAYAALVDLPRAVRDRVRPPLERSFALALAAFVDAIRGCGRAGADLEDGLRSLAVVTSAERAARSGQSVTVTEVGGLTPDQMPGVQHAGWLGTRA